MEPRVRAGLLLLAATFASCMPGPTPAPSPSSVALPSVDQSGAPSPSPAASPLVGSITETAVVGGVLGPFPAEEAARIAVTATDALNTVLTAKRERGWPDADIAWKDGGCVLLAWYQPTPMSYNPEPGPPYGLYLVRLVDPVNATMGTWVTVNATTGELGWAGDGPSTRDCPGLATG